MPPKKQGPTAPPLEPEARYTFSDIQKFLNLFTELLKDSPAVKWSIYAAGIAGALETAHLVWLFGVWFYWYSKTH